jgi:hypothetical protein
MRHEAHLAVAAQSAPVIGAAIERIAETMRTPPMRAAAKRRSRAGLGWSAGPRRGVYGALAERLTE